jgi:hypothetical protein
LVVPMPRPASKPASKSKLPASPLLDDEGHGLGYGVEPPNPPGALATSGGWVELLHPRAHPSKIIAATADFMMASLCTRRDYAALAAKPVSGRASSGMPLHVVEAPATVTIHEVGPQAELLLGA